MKALRSPYVFLTFTALVWSTNFILGHILIQSLPPFVITFFRFAAALPILLVLAARSKDRPPLPARRLLPLIAALGITGVFLFNPIAYIGLKYTTVINSSIINSFSPALIAVLSALWLKEIITLKQKAGFLLSVLGVVVIVIHGSWHTLVSFQFNAGDLITLGAVVDWALYSVLSKKALQYLSPLAVTAYGTFAGLALLLPAAAWEWAKLPPFPLSRVDMAIFAYLGIFASVIGFILWNRGIKELGAARAGAFYNLIPVFATATAILFLNEHLHFYDLAGGILVLLGIYFSAGVKGVSRREEQAGKPENVSI